MPYCGHLVEVTFHCNGPLVRSLSCPLASGIPKGGFNLALSEVRKQLLGGFASRLPCLGPIERKMLILSSSSDIQVNTHGVSGQFLRNFQTDLGSLDLSYRENMMEQRLGCLLFRESVGVVPKLTQSGEIVTEK